MQYYKVDGDYWLVMFSSWKIPIFEKGYEKDPAVVAKEAIQEATRNGSDVVLVDTAGRMQVSCLACHKRCTSVCYMNYPNYMDT